MEGFIILIIFIILNWVLDDVVGMFLLSFVEFGLLTNITKFIDIGSMNLLFYALVIGIMCLSSSAKTFYLIRTKRM